LGIHRLVYGKGMMIYLDRGLVVEYCDERQLTFVTRPFQGSTGLIHRVVDGEVTDETLPYQWWQEDLFEEGIYKTDVGFPEDLEGPATQTFYVRTASTTGENATGRSRRTTQATWRIRVVTEHCIRMIYVFRHKEGDPEQSYVMSEATIHLDVSEPQKGDPDFVETLLRSASEVAKPEEESRKQDSSWRAW
jgi:hypothetical protein